MHKAELSINLKGGGFAARVFENTDENALYDIIGNKVKEFINEFRDTDTPVISHRIRLIKDIDIYDEDYGC